MGSPYFLIFRIPDPRHFVIQFQALISRIPHHFMIFKKIKIKKKSKNQKIFTICFPHFYKKLICIENVISMREKHHNFMLKKWTFK